MDMTSRMLSTTQISDVSRDLSEQIEQMLVSDTL
jgi:hypothetical protein